MVMNGPTPIMSIMLSAVALHRPIPRMRVGELAMFSEEYGILGSRSLPSEDRPRTIAREEVGSSHSPGAARTPHAPAQPRLEDTCVQFGGKVFRSLPKRRTSRGIEDILFCTGVHWFE